MALPASNTVIEWETHRGRQNELNRTEAGTARVLLQNRDGRYDPTNDTSPYAGTILPFKQAKINVSHPILGYFRDIYTGYIESWNYTRRGPRGAEVELNLMDGFELLSNAQVVPDGAQAGGAAFYASQRVDDRIKALLADAGWPLARTNIYTGSINVQDIRYSPGTSFLTALLDTADAEFPGVANCYIGKSGYFNFRGRFDRLDYVDYPRAQWFVGDDEAIALNDRLAPIFDMSYNMDKSTVVNTSLVIPNLVVDADVPGQRVTNGTSVLHYGERALDIQGLIILDNWRDSLTALEDCHRFAQYYVDNYKTPLPRIDSIEFHGQMGELDPAREIDWLRHDGTHTGTLWDFFLQVEIGDIVWVNTFHPGGGGFDTVGFFVEGIHNTVKNLNDLYPDWRMTLDLSPIQLFATWDGSFPLGGSDSPSGGDDGGCFVAGTLVSTPDGRRAIEEIEVGDLVYVWEFDSASLVAAPVTELERHEGDGACPVYLLSVPTAPPIYTTFDHRFYTDVGWVQASALAGSRVRILRGSSLRQASVRSIGPVEGEPQNVYNLHVDHPDHNYFAAGVLVHNVKAG